MKNNLLLDQTKKTLFLDLDETLVHTCDGGKNYQHLLKYVDDEGKKSEVKRIDKLISSSFFFLL